MGYEIRFPDGLAKAVTFSFDDGKISDRRLAQLFNKYNVKATFHLNSGKFGQDDYISSDEVNSLYNGHEVSCHTVSHPFPSSLTGSQMMSELTDDRKNLEALAGYPVRGLSYPYGEYFDEFINTAVSSGLEYSRTVQSTYGFALPSDFMKWHPTCHQSEADKLVDRFFEKDEHLRIKLFYIWGHSYEFDRDNTWDYMENVLKELSGKDNVWYATNIEIKDYLTAARNLISSLDGTMLCNRYALPVYIESSGQIIKINPGETVSIK